MVAVSTEESQKNYQSLISQGITSDQISQYSTAQNFGPKLNSQETAAILGNFKVQGSPYSAENVTATVLNPTPKPNLADPYGLYDYYMKSPEIMAATTDMQNLTNQLNTFDTQTEQQQNVIKNAPDETLQYIPGAMNQAAEQAAIQRAGIARELLAKQSFLDTMRTEATNKYNIAVGERDKVQELISKTGGKAGISYADSYETAVQKADTYDLKIKYPTADIKSSDDANTIADKIYKYNQKEATKNLFMQTFGYVPTGKTTSWMEKQLKKQFKSSKEVEKQKNALANEYTKAQINSMNATATKKLGGGSKGGSSKSASKTISTSSSGYDYYKLGSNGKKVKISKMQYENLQKREARKKKKTTNRSL